MIRAAVYQALSPKGVAMKTIPLPQLSGTRYVPNQGNFPKLIVMTALSLLMTAISLVLSMIRVVCPAVPGTYGAFKDRHLILCKVHAVGVNPVDAKRLYGDKVPHFLMPFVIWLLENRVCGIDFSGTVVGVPDEYARSSGSKSVNVGDDIFGVMPPFSGSLAEYVLVPSDMIALKPKNFTFALAAALPLVGLTALQALEGAEKAVQRNRRHCTDTVSCSPPSASSSSSSSSSSDEVLNVLVLGASGGTGHVALQVAKARGHRVTAVCGTRNRDWVQSLGADTTICYDSGEDLLQLLHDEVDQHGLYSVVFDSVSSDDPRDAVHGYEQRLLSTGSVGGGRVGVLDRHSGVYLMLGGHASDWVKAHLLRFCGLNLFGRHRLLFWVRFPICFYYLDTLRGYCEEGRLVTVLADTYPFTEEGVRGAFGAVMSRRTAGKLVVRVSEEAMRVKSTDTVTLL